MNEDTDEGPAGIDPPESRLDRTVRLALTAGQLRVELREARARLERVETYAHKVGSEGHPEIAAALCFILAGVE